MNHPPSGPSRKRLRPKQILWLTIASGVALACLCGSLLSAFDGDSAPAGDSSSTTPPPTASSSETTPSDTDSPTPEDTESATPTPEGDPTTEDPEGDTDPRYGTCTEARRHGAGPYRRGVDQEYHWYEDRDNDGVVCER